MAAIPNGFAFTYFTGLEGRQYVVLTDSAGQELFSFEPTLPQGVGVVDFTSFNDELALACYQADYLPDEIHRGLLVQRYAHDGTPLGQNYCINDTSGQSTVTTGYAFHLTPTNRMEAAMVIKDYSSPIHQYTTFVGAESSETQVSWNLSDTLNNVYRLYALTKNSEQEMVLAIRRNNQSVTNEYLDFWACDSTGVKLGEPLTIALPDSQFSTDIKLVTLGESFYAVYSYGNLGWPDNPLQIWMTAFTTSDILPANKPVTVPEVIALSAWPNPFNSFVSIEYSLPVQIYVTLSVYDILGRHVETLLQETQIPGMHRAYWHAGPYASGSYFIRLENLSARTVQKIMLIR